MRSKNILCFLLATLALPVSIASSRSDTQQDAHLRAADVPVQPLRHWQSDPSAEFSESFALQVAVLQTSEEGGMLGLVHALREMGIPFFVTRDLDQALRHSLVIVYPSAEGRTFNGEQIHKLNVHMSAGGSLLSFNVVAGNLKPFFGFRDAVPSRRRHRVVFDRNSDPIEQYLNCLLYTSKSRRPIAGAARKRGHRAF